MRVGVVVEGWTDWVVLRELLAELYPGSSLTLIHPRQDELDAGRGGGWTEIRRWLRVRGRHLTDWLEFGGYAWLLLHLDGDVAPGESRPCRPTAAAQWEAVSETALRWAGLTSWPDEVVLAIPLQKLEAWVCAALDGCKAKHPGLECLEPMEQAPKRYREAMRERDGRAYEEVFAPSVARHWRDRVVSYCPVGAGRLDEALARKREAL